MRILIDIGHPGQVHFIKNMAWNLQKKGHEILITVSDKEMALNLLDAYGLPYKKVGAKGNLLYHLLESPVKVLRLYRVARRFKPDLLCGAGNPFFTLVGKILGKHTIAFDDCDINSPLINIPTFSLATVVCTPSCFTKDLGKKHVRYEGYHELACLHPNYFQPDPSVLKENGLAENDRFIIIRFISQQTVDWVTQKTLNMEKKRKLMQEVERYGRVIITSETPLPQEFDEYKIKVPPERIHHLLYYAQMFIGDGATMNTEAAILGTPSIRFSSFAGPNDLGNFRELEEKYGLLYSFSELDEVIEKVIELLEQRDLKEQWAKKRERLLADKIDVTQFMVWFIENYPESFREMKENPKIQYRFKGLK